MLAVGLVGLVGYGMAQMAGVFAPNTDFEQHFSKTLMSGVTGCPYEKLSRVEGNYTCPD